jgi:hypothetical protein
MLESDTIIPIGQRPLNPLIGLGDHVHTNNVDMVRLRASWLLPRDCKFRRLALA